MNTRKFKIEKISGYGKLCFRQANVNNWWINKAGRFEEPMCVCVWKRQAFGLIIEPTVATRQKSTKINYLYTFTCVCSWECRAHMPSVRAQQMNANCLLHANERGSKRASEREIVFLVRCSVKMYIRNSLGQLEFKQILSSTNEKKKRKSHTHTNRRKS